MNNEYTNIFDDIDINMLTIEDAWSIFEEMSNPKKDKFDSCIENCFTFDTTSFPDVLNDAFLLFGFSDSKQRIEDFFSEKSFQRKNLFVNGVSMKLEDVKYHKSKFDSSGKADKVELFFIYRAFYMLHEFFKW